MRQGIAQVGLGVPVRSDKQNGSIETEMHDVAEKLERSAIRPLQVVEHNHERLAGRRVPQKARDLIMQTETSLISIETGFRLCLKSKLRRLR